MIGDADTGYLTAAFVIIFGVTGDLAYKKIFPALQALAARGQLALMIGAGASIPAGLPSWEELIDQLVGHPTYVDDGATPCQCSGCVIARAVHMLPREVPF